MCVDRQDDPEARIRDLERPLSDAAGKSEPGASKRSGYAEYRRNASTHAGFLRWRSAWVVVAVGLVVIATGAVVVAQYSGGGSTIGSAGDRTSSTTSKPSVGSPNNNVEIHTSYNTYGEVPVPGTKTLHLSQGRVEISFDAAESPQDCDGQGFCGWGLPMPDLSLTITPPVSPSLSSTKRPAPYPTSTASCISRCGRPKFSKPVTTRSQSMETSTGSSAPSSRSARRSEDCLWHRPLTYKDIEWPGPGSNRRPSAFQADARTN